jgi:hypothetical protein
MVVEPPFFYRDNMEVLTGEWSYLHGESEKELGISGSKKSPPPFDGNLFNR